MDEDRLVVVVAGHICLDFLPSLKDISPTTDLESAIGHLIRVGPAVFRPGGCVGNVSMAFVKLLRSNDEVEAVAAIEENDILGACLLKELGNNGIKSTPVLCKTENSSSSYSVVCQFPMKDRIILHHVGLNSYISADNLCDSFSASSLSTASVFYFGYLPLLPCIYSDTSSLRRIFEYQKYISPPSCISAMDLAQPGSDCHSVKWREILEKALPFVDVFSASLEELLILLFPNRFGEITVDCVVPSLLHELSSLLLSFGCACVMIKLGEYGCYVRTRSLLPSRLNMDDSWQGREVWAPGLSAHELLSTCGAGDVSSAAFVSAMCQKLEFIDAVMVAMAAGCDCVENSGGASQISSLQTLLESSWRDRDRNTERISILRKESYNEMVGWSWGDGDECRILFGPRDTPTVRIRIGNALKRTHGIIFGCPEIVWRSMYSGRSIIAQNSSFVPNMMDSRGYLAVEWWIMSIVEADNAKRRSGEGLTSIRLDESSTNDPFSNILLSDVLGIMSNELTSLSFEECRRRWPLVKVLDIGGEGIPCHVHSGRVVSPSEVRGPGKAEAYFMLPYPPDQPVEFPFGHVVTRIGLKENVVKDNVIKALKEFGESNAMFELLEAYQVKPEDAWSVPACTLHAPAPYPTLEIQLPQDDFNLASYLMDVKVNDSVELEKMKRELQLRGLKDEEAFALTLVDYSVTGENCRRQMQLMEEDEWGYRKRIFFDPFFGEMISIKAQKVFHSDSCRWMRGYVVWKGIGVANGTPISGISICSVESSLNSEFLIPKETELSITAESDLVIFVFECSFT